jgi:predicted methyltransferase
MQYRSVFGCVGFILAAVSSAALAATSAEPGYIKDAVTAAGRPLWEIQTDAARKPDVILEFSGIKPGQAVGELVPGYGYYTRLLSKLVGQKGNVYAVVLGGGGGGRWLRQAQREGKAPAVIPKEAAQGCARGCYPDGMGPYMIPVDHILAIQNIWDYRNVTTLWEGLEQYGGNFAIPEQADAVFSADGLHELYAPGTKLNVVNLDKSILASLKPNGVFVVVDDPKLLSPDKAKADILAAGFMFDSESHALPDKFVFKFRKPANMTGDKRPPKGTMNGYFGNTQVVNEGSDSAGGANGPRERREQYSADGTYQEFGHVGMGPAPMQAGRYFWDAAGHNCQLHEYPIDERGNVVCHDYIQAHKPGDVWGAQGNGRPHKLVAGHQPID